MSLVEQKTIDQYLVEKQVPEDKKEKVLLVITEKVYNRNQNVIKMERETDEVKRIQYAKSVEEYDEMILETVDNVVAGKQEGNYDF